MGGMLDPRSAGLPGTCEDFASDSQHFSVTRFDPGAVAQGVGSMGL
jgi:hypothetical protein